MKMAVTAKGKNLDSQVDPRFGRAAYILIIDTDTLAVEALDNSQNVNAFKGAGIQAASMISDRGVEVLLTGFCGPNAFKTLKAANVKVANDFSGAVKDAVKEFKEQNDVFAETPNIEGKW
jgi:predicted Fe-Mo cluster-binding NifX family protein